MLKNISTIGKALNKKEQKDITGGMSLNPFICGGTGGKRTNYTQEQCVFFGHSWHFGACYICY